MSAPLSEGDEVIEDPQNEGDSLALNRIISLHI